MAFCAFTLLRHTIEVKIQRKIKEEDRDLIAILAE